MADLTEADSDQLRQIETRIKSIAMRMVLDIGEQLIEAKRLLGHGAFGRWIKSNVGMTVRNANRYMAATRRFGKLDIMSNLPTTVLLELSSESVPDAAVTQVLHLVEQGEAVSVRRTKEIIQEYRQCPVASSVAERYGISPGEVIRAGRRAAVHDAFLVANDPTTAQLCTEVDDLTIAAASEFLPEGSCPTDEQLASARAILQVRHQATANPESSGSGHSQSHFADEIFKRHACKLDRAGAERLIQLLHDSLIEHHFFPEQFAQSIIDRFGDGTDELRRVVRYLVLGPPLDPSEAIPCTRDTVTQQELFDDDIPF